jgi:hypothetical protein
MDLYDVVITAATLLVVFNWKSVTPAVIPKKRDKRKAAFYEFYRRNGIDMLRAEDIIRELKRRGRDDFPHPMFSKDKFYAMAELEVMLDETRNSPADVMTQETNVAVVNTRGDSAWARPADGDDN